MTHWTYTFDGSTAQTRYADGSSSSLDRTTDEDRYHARLLRISPVYHRGFHELCHHVISTALRLGDDNVIYRAAHSLPQPLRARSEEWFVTAWQYFIAGRYNNAEHLDYGALIDLRNSRCDLEKMARATRSLWAYHSHIQLSSQRLTQLLE